MVFIQFFVAIRSCGTRNVLKCFCKVSTNVITLAQRLSNWGLCFIIFPSFFINFACKTNNKTTKFLQVNSVLEINFYTSNLHTFFILFNINWYFWEKQLNPKRNYIFFITYITFHTLFIYISTLFLFIITLFLTHLPTLYMFMFFICLYNPFS